MGRRRRAERKFKQQLREWGQAKKPTAPFGRCIVCEQELGIKGGCAGTGMCGPCCTGEAAMLDEKGESW